MKTLTIFVILLGLSQCKNNLFIKNPPFTIEKKMYTNWVGGLPGVSGIKLEIHLKNISEIAFDSLYFQNRRAKVELIKKNEITQLIGHFSTSALKDLNLIFSIGLEKKLKNKPKKIKKLPFNLQDNEAILSYKVQGKIQYFKIENIKQVYQEN